MRSLARFAAGSFLALSLASPAPAGQVGRDADLARSGWYANQPALSPAAVSSGQFGQLFSTAITGQVYAQPLVWNGTLLVVTEADWIYGLEPATGAIQWSRNVGTPWNATDIAHCDDLFPTIGITATPVIDTTTGIAYFTAKSYKRAGSKQAQWQIHAIAVATGAEQAGFPVTISGAADNDAGQTFPPITENQRTGLLLMGGVVYAGFSSVCDTDPFQGWVVGVSTAGAVTAKWVDRMGNGTSGGGIWMSGSGFVSDTTGQFLFATGNGMGGGTTTTPAPGSSPPGDISEAIVRMQVQPNGSLQPVDFFTPAGAAGNFDPNDDDLGSGGVVELPSTPFGTAAHPDLLVQIGKPGTLYVLDAHALGGYEQGPDGGDAIVQEIGPDGAVWSKPAVWGGDGGWIYFPTGAPPLSSGGSSGWLHAYRAAVDAAGLPTLDFAGSSADAFGFSSSAPVVTSNGPASGSALVWIIWAADYTGENAELRAYDPVPVAGTLNLRWSAPVGTGPKFSPPGIAAGRLYVGTRDGHVLGFGLSPSALGVAPAAGTPRVALGPARPNPCRGATRFDVTLPARAPASLAIYDAGGRCVRTLLSGEVAASALGVAWDGRGEDGARVAPGLYLARLDAGEAHVMRRVLVVP